MSRFRRMTVSLSSSAGSRVSSDFPKPPFLTRPLKYRSGSARTTLSGETRMVLPPLRHVSQARAWTCDPDRSTMNLRREAAFSRHDIEDDDCALLARQLRLTGCAACRRAA